MRRKGIEQFRPINQNHPAMLTQEKPETFSPEVEEEGTIAIELSAYLVRQLRAVSFAIGGLSVEQIIETMLQRDPENIVQEMADAYEDDWNDPAEFIRLHEAKAIAEKAGSDWEAFFEKAATMQSF